MTWGAVPVPLHAQISNLIRNQFNQWLSRKMVAPNGETGSDLRGRACEVKGWTIQPICRLCERAGWTFHPKKRNENAESITDADINKAIIAAAAGRDRGRGEGIPHAFDLEIAWLPQQLWLAICCLPGWLAKWPHAAPCSIQTPTWPSSSSTEGSNENNQVAT